MQQFFEEYIGCLQSLHDEMKDALRGLPQAALDWVPGPKVNSLAVHLSGAERFWIGDVAMGEPSGRNREAEFQARGLGNAALVDRLDSSMAYARRALDGLTLEDLEVVHISPRDGREYTVGWCLMHALEHTALHLGHIQVTRQFWAQTRDSSPA